MMTEKNQREIFAKNLSNYIYKTRKSQKEIAKEIGISAGAISTWANGTRYPRPEAIKILAKYFNCSISDLTEDVSDLPTNADARIKLIAREISESEELMKIFLEMKDKSPEEIKKATDVLKAMYGK